MATPNHFLAIPPGADLSDPTRASKPPSETYKAPKLDRGSVVIERTGPDGQPLPRTRYGQNQADTPSSVGCTQAAGSDGTGLSDFDIAPRGGDPVLRKLALEGFGDQSSEDSAVADLQRKIPTNQAVPDAYGMASARSRQASYPGPDSSVPATLSDDDAQPVRKPS
jgi:hypothetical protein